MPIRYSVVENVVTLPKSAEKVAAGFLVLTTFAVYNPATDVVKPPRQAKYFAEPEVFLSAMPAFKAATNRSAYTTSTDIRRQAQAKYFADPEVFTKNQPSNNIVVLSTVSNAAQLPTVFRQVRYVFLESQTIVRSQKPARVVWDVPIIPPSSGTADVFRGQDTSGWPQEMFDPPVFVSRAPFSTIVLNTYTQYSYATDVQRARQGKYFQDPEIVISIQKGWFGGGPAQNFVAYNPATDVQRRHQGLYFPDPEVYLRPAPFDQLIINGTIAPYVPAPQPPTISDYTADSNQVTADSINYSCDGADLSNNGAVDIPETPPGQSSNRLAYSVSVPLFVQYKGGS
jgi:hypothetical protein